mmetsp:Transcript_46464/g.140750  ORF Transcript_46464/g.140750 Transcript_46464/m.140750 type:complete len:147 (+) Transcript_46464:94-534(+)
MSASEVDSKPAVAAPAATAGSGPNAADARYTFDDDRLQSLRSRAPWKDNPKYFTAAAFSPSAVMKMLTHCHSGVEKGLKKGGNPIEVMGLMLGRPDPDTPTTLVVTDVFPLPIEGFETVSEKIPRIVVNIRTCFLMNNPVEIFDVI